MTTTRAAHFSADGTRYLVHDVDLIASADSDLWNDTMRVQIDHRGRVSEAGFQQPNMTPYADNLRCFFVRDDATGRYWSAPHDPVQAAPDAFTFSAGLCDIAWHVETDGIAVDLRLAVPRADNVELWTATVTNLSRTRRAVSLYSYLPVGRRSLLRQTAWFDTALNGALHDYFDYYVHYRDYYRLRELRNMVFCTADRKPVSYSLSAADFAGKAGLHAPAALSRKTLGPAPDRYEAANEATVNAFQFRRSLAAGKSFTVNLVFGPARDRREAARLSRAYLKAGAIDTAIRASRAFLDAHAPAVRIATPDIEFNHFINHWQSRRSLMLARTIRFNLAPQGRNVIQDAMGGSYVDPASSRDWFRRIWAHQHRNGWLPHGMPFAEGVKQIEINAIPHKDINSWGPTAVTFYMNETGDRDILDVPIPFADAPETCVPLYEHVCLGLEWLIADRTRRKLCRIGQGDWNDPLNMAGLHERGESIWLTEATVHALETWADVAVARGEGRRATRFRKAAAESRAAVNALAWDGRWYVRGFTDAGLPFGSHRDREGKIFINAQSWAIIAGVADRARADACVAAVDALLDTPAGPMTLGPAFTAMREDIGKLSQKVPGWHENGSVYCHATTFYAYALFAARKSERGFAVLRSLLPGHGAHTIARAGQIPLYVPNFYRGRDGSAKAGQSSHAPNTGTASWYYRTAIGMLLGVRAEPDGLRLDPQLPRRWRTAAVERHWRGATYDIRIARRRTPNGLPPEVTLDGVRRPDNLVPVQPAGTRHTVTVRAD